MNYVIFEDQFTHLLSPFSDFHASFEIRCGQFENIDRIISILDPTDSITLIVRKELEEVISEKYNSLNVNPRNIMPGTWLNGATLWDENTLDKLLKEFQIKKELPIPKVFQPVRIALTGTSKSPSLGLTLSLFDKNEAIARIDRLISL